MLDRFQVNNLVLLLNLVRFCCQDFVKILHVSYLLQLFKVAPAISHMVMLQQPSFINRLIGTDDDQLTSIRSPYTSRLKYLLVDFTCITESSDKKKLIFLKIEFIFFFQLCRIVQCTCL